MSNDLHAQLANIVGIETSAAWNICGSAGKTDGKGQDQLYLLGLKPETDASRFPTLRGTVVDLQAKTVVSQSFPYTPTVVADELVPGDVVTLTDVDGVVHKLDTEHLRITVGYEGFLVHVFKHDGVIYFHTRKRMSLDRSHWGKSGMFSDLYAAAGGPIGDNLFDPKCTHSPYCHVFIVSHPNILVSSKMDVGPNGTLIYLGSKQMWDPTYASCPYKQKGEDGQLLPGITQEEFDADPRPAAGWIEPFSKEGEIYSFVGVEAPRSLSLEEANVYLQVGDKDDFHQHSDFRINPGEFVILHQLDPISGEETMIRVESRAYAWRCQLRNNDPNLLHRFYQLVNGSYLHYETPEGKAAYDALYPQMGAVNMADRDGRLYNIWLAFMHAIPPCRTVEATGFYMQLKSERYQLIGWLSGLGQLAPAVVSQLCEELQIIMPKRVHDILGVALSTANHKLQTKTNFDRQGLRLSKKRMMFDSIRNLVGKEAGASLYRLVRTMKQWNLGASATQADPEVTE